MRMQELWKEVDILHDKEFPDHELRPIHGAGKTSKPRFMLLFINPTARNSSTSRSWKGPRYPFIGTKQIWRILARAGMFDEKLLLKIEQSKDWPLGLVQEVEWYLAKNDLYITNIVKWAGHDAALPDRKKVALFLPLLEQEIEIVQPHYIIAFGLIPFEALTKEKIKLDDYYREVLHGEVQTFKKDKTQVIPCYFPIGRGNPKRAVEMLKHIKKMD